MGAEKNEIVWLAWEHHRRTLELSKFLGLTPELYQNDLCRFIKHPVFAVKTTMYLFRKKPRIVIIQSPSIVLAVLACFLKSILSYKLVVDAHNGAIFPEKHRFIIGLLNIIINKSADMIVVTNENMAKKVADSNGKPFVLPDRLPLFNVSHGNKKHPDEFIIVSICTYSDDEPYIEMLLAASELSKSHAKFIFTGNFRKLEGKLLSAVGDSVCFTGYLPENDFISLLGSAHLIIDLTKRENCLVCGAYEAVACGVPLVLSKHEVLKTYFYKGAVYTENNIEGIKASILAGIADYAQLKTQIIELRDEIRHEWETVGSDFLKRIELFYN